MEGGREGGEGEGGRMVTCLAFIPLQLSVKVKGRRMLKAVTKVTKRIALHSLGFEDSRRDKPVFRSAKK